MPSAYHFLPIRLVPALAAVLCLFGAASLADDLSREQVTFFEQKIRPVLVKHCYECHSTQAAKLKGGLLLDSRAGWQKGGDSGEPAIQPGNPEQSLIIRVVRHDEAGLEMPPEKPKLPAAVIADLVVWVKMGASDPRTGAIEVKRADKSWWSLQPLPQAELPSPTGLPEAWSHSPIDRFVYAKLAEQGLEPNPPADPRVLIRRLYYDLTGLPPTPEEVEEFVSQFSPSPPLPVSQSVQQDVETRRRGDLELAYESLIDRLLSSPHYGERWGRHWLDVVRFGESNGFERNVLIDDAWPFRDYVIRSFNEDKPFNQFIVEHLAGDVVGRDRPEVEIGVAFLTIGPYDNVGNQDPIAQATIRANTVDDMVTAAGTAFLGLTVNCARCHHHKFDPIPTEDYYRLKAAFDGVSHGSRKLATPEARREHAGAVKPLEERKIALAAERDAIDKEIVSRAQKANRPEPHRPPPSAHRTEETFAPVEALHVQFKILATTSNPKSGVDARLDEFEIWTSGKDSHNVALASAGAKAVGASARVAKDFDEAYDVRRVNDGQYGARWFVGNPPVLTVTLAKPTTIDRVVFSHDRTVMSDRPVAGLGAAVAEYEVLVSTDGQVWRKVADSFDRKPVIQALAKERQLRDFTTPDERSRLAAIDRELVEIDRQLAKIPPLPEAWVARFQQPDRPTTVFRGGDPQKPGDLIKPASLSVLDQVTKPYELSDKAAESERRLSLARWIASDENPLTARVLANRVWHYHFGVGIVDTPSDFGFLGGRPSHAELLDWLARRLQQHDWKLKALHREIVLSQTYRQSSTPRDAAAKVDKDSRLLWRFPLRRLGAEEVRDTLLTVAGKLDPRMGGPGFRLYDAKQDNVVTYVPLDRPGPETYRRAVYHQSVRASVVDVLSDFDLPDNAFAAPRRANTTTPLQALTMLNHRFTFDMAAALADRVKREAGNDLTAQLMRLYQLAYQRRATAEEIAAAASLAKSYGLPAICRAILNSNELLYVE